MWNSKYIVADRVATVAPNVNVDTRVNRTTRSRWARLTLPAKAPSLSLESIARMPMTKL